MGFYTGAIGEVLRKSLNLGYVIRILLVGIISVILFLIALAIVVLPLILTGFATSSLGLIGGNLSIFVIIFLLILLVLGILFLVFVSAIISFMSGMGTFLAKQLLDSQQLSIGNAWNSTKPRMRSLFKVNLIVMGIMILFFALLALLALIFIIPQTLGPGVNIFALIAGIGAFILLAVLIILILVIVLLPFFALYETVAIFESDYSARVLLKKAWGYSRKNYGMSLIFIILFAVVCAIISALTGWIPILGIIISLWITSASYLFYLKLYELNKERM
ncbi:MAG: hypothetical protein Q7S21_04400 [archaeon]|nr:hypothetical protein [archaeon]